MAYEKKGHKLRGRQSLGRYQLLISNKNNHSKELLDQHVRQPAGDHSLALQCLRQEYGGESEEAPAVKKRRTVSLSPFEEHAIFLAYTCLRLGLTEKDFHTMSQTAYSLGAQISEAHWSSRFYKEVTTAAATNLWERLVAKVKGSDVLSICADEACKNGNSYFVLGAHYLTEKLELWHLLKYVLTNLMSNHCS